MLIKKIRWLFLLAIISASSVYGDELFDWHYNTVNGTVIIEELLRQPDLTILKINTQASGTATVNSGKGVIQAAVDVGVMLKQRYFVLLDGRAKDDGYYVTVYYSNNPEVDPATAYPDYFSANAREQWLQHGYNDIAAIMKKLQHKEAAHEKIKK